MERWRFWRKGSVGRRRRKRRRGEFGRVEEVGIFGSWVAWGRGWGDRCDLMNGIFEFLFTVHVLQLMIISVRTNHFRPGFQNPIPANTTESPSMPASTSNGSPGCPILLP